MKAGLRLLLNVLAWFVAIPVFFMTALALKDHTIDWFTDYLFHSQQPYFCFWHGLLRSIGVVSRLPHPFGSDSSTSRPFSHPC